MYGRCLTTTYNFKKTLGIYVYKSFLDVLQSPKKTAQLRICHHLIVETRKPSASLIYMLLERLKASKVSASSWHYAVADGGRVGPVGKLLI